MAVTAFTRQELEDRGWQFSSQEIKKEREVYGELLATTSPTSVISSPPTVLYTGGVPEYLTGMDELTDREWADVVIADDLPLIANFAEGVDLRFTHVGSQEMPSENGRIVVVKSYACAVPVENDHGDYIIQMGAPRWLLPADPSFGFEGNTVLSLVLAFGTDHRKSVYHSGVGLANTSNRPLTIYQ